MAKRSMKVYDFFGALVIAVPTAVVATIVVVWVATN